MNSSTISKEIENLYNSSLQHVQKVIRKIENMQNDFLIDNEDYSLEDQEKISSYFNVFAHKYVLSFFHLELLWNQSELSREEVIETLKNNSIDNNWSNSRHTIASLFLESYLFQARALMDVYFRYIALVLKLKVNSFKSTNKFLDHLEKQTDNQKAIDIHKYLSKSVYNENQWGIILKGLRDKITHFDKINYNYDGTEIIWDKVKLDWPTLGGLTYDRFAQETVDNNLFEMFVSISEILYESKWQSG